MRERVTLLFLQHGQSVSQHYEENLPLRSSHLIVKWLNCVRSVSSIWLLGGCIHYVLLLPPLCDQKWNLGVILSAGTKHIQRRRAQHGLNTKKIKWCVFVVQLTCKQRRVCDFQRLWLNSAFLFKYYFLFFIPQSQTQHVPSNNQQKEELNQGEELMS